jgi:excisionase family DNA binding protein
MEPRDEKLWGLNEVGEYLGIPRSSIYKMTSAGTIPHVKLGGRVRFRRKDIDRWLDLQVISNEAVLARAKKFAQAR